MAPRCSNSSAVSCGLSDSEKNALQASAVATDHGAVMICRAPEMFLCSLLSCLSMLTAAELISPADGWSSFLRAQYTTTSIHFDPTVPEARVACSLLLRPSWHSVPRSRPVHTHPQPSQQSCRP